MVESLDSALKMCCDKIRKIWQEGATPSAPRRARGKTLHGGREGAAPSAPPCPCKRATTAGRGGRGSVRAVMPVGNHATTVGRVHLRPRRRACGKSLRLLVGPDPGRRRARGKSLRLLVGPDPGRRRVTRKRCRQLLSVLVVTCFCSVDSKVIENYKKCCMCIGNAFFTERGITFIGWREGVVSP